MANILHDLACAFKTRRVCSPLRLAFRTDELLNYLKSAPYSWETTDSGYRGMLERGFGRVFIIEWDTASGSLKLTTRTKFHFLFYYQDDVAVTTLSGIPAEVRERLLEVFRTLMG